MAKAISLDFRLRVYEAPAGLSCQIITLQAARLEYESRLV